jgi:EAL domain-containing protein (putative c-di-GMP-specific phosphodiesterase class I)
LLAAILGVGRALSLAVVAEGVEDQGQITTLEAMGCKMAQGFLIGRPSPAEAIKDLLHTDASRSAVGSQAV